jgi:hypothetical protein
LYHPFVVIFSSTSANAVVFSRGLFNVIGIFKKSHASITLSVSRGKPRKTRAGGKPIISQPAA